MRYQKCSATGTGTPVNPVTVTRGADSSEMLPEPLPRLCGRGLTFIQWQTWLTVSWRRYLRFSCRFFFLWWQTAELKWSQTLFHGDNKIKNEPCCRCLHFRLVVWCLRPVQPERHVLHPRTAHREAERYQVALLQGPQLLTTSHSHDDPPAGLLLVFWTAELLPYEWLCSILEGGFLL